MLTQGHWLTASECSVVICIAPACQNWVTSQALRDPAAAAGPMRVTPAELVVDALRQGGKVTKTGAELLFEVFSQRYERGSTLVSSNLPFQEWTEVLGSERLTGALLDRLNHHVHILEMACELRLCLLCLRR
jgi:hypothetical protein